MSQRKTERLLNLVICLLATRRHLTLDRIREAVPGYPESDEAFKRMFERDKEELRELGIPLETGSTSVWDDELGYRIRPAAYELPPISLESDEAAALALAARVWQHASMAEAASGALLKLRAAGVETGDATPPGIEPRVDTTEPSFPALWRAVRDRRPVSFDYRPPPAREVQPRRLEPWGVVSWHGRWYVAGHDRDRNAVRVFRLSRIVGEVRPGGPPGTVAVPGDADVRQIVTSSAEDTPRRVATIRVRTGAADGLRRAASRCQPDDQGWEVAELGFSNPERLAGFVAGFGPDAVVLDPPDLKEAVVRRLRSVLQEGSVGEGAVPENRVEAR